VPETLQPTGGAAAIIDTTVTINAQGTASHPSSQSGPGASSQFSLQLSGTFKDSIAQGLWNIQFTDTMWQGWINPGRFAGRLQSGSGVTALH